MTDHGHPELHRIVLESVPLALCVVNREGKVLLWSAGAEHLTGYLRQDVLGRLCPDNLHQASDDETGTSASRFPPLLQTLREGRPVTAHLSIRTKNGHLVPVHLESVPLRDDNGIMIGAAEICHTVYKADMAERRQARLAAYGCLDPITGMLNHSMIQARLKESLNLYALYPVPFCILCLSIDNLTKIRERFGQAAVDATLRIVAQSIEHGLRPTDHVGRWLDQEFLVILNECGESDVHKVAERLCRIARKADVSWWGDILHVTVSVGATVAHDHDVASSMISRAEGALRASTDAGGNQVNLMVS